MAVDPYVPTRPEDAPRRSVAVPPARGWRATRPGDVDFADTSFPPGCGPGGLFGSPGPDSGYALTLAKRFLERIEIAPPETKDDAMAVAAEVAMRRAALFGRAPVMPDLEIGYALFGWLGGAPPELVEWRRHAAAGAEHHYSRRRALVDAVPEAVLRRRPEEIRQEPPGRWRELPAAPA